jgi:hypothetical protein
MIRLLLILGLIFTFIYPCYAGDTFLKGYYRPKQASQRLRGRSNQAGNILNNPSQNETAQTQELKSFITYYDKPDYGLTIVRDDDDAKYIRRDKIKQKPKKRRNISKKQSNSNRGYAVEYNEEK